MGVCVLLSQVVFYGGYVLYLPTDLPPISGNKQNNKNSAEATKSHFAYLDLLISLAGLTAGAAERGEKRGVRGLPAAIGECHSAGELCFLWMRERRL